LIESAGAFSLGSYDGCSRQGPWSVYKFNRYWKNISDDVIDLIFKKILVVNPNERITAIKALQYPWFTSDGHVIKTEHLMDNLHQLKIFLI
jgi:serine/threonine protein kinase